MKKGIRRVEFFPAHWELVRCFDAAVEYGFQGMELIFRSGRSPVNSSLRRSMAGMPSGYHSWQTLRPSVTLTTSQEECSVIRSEAERRGIQICSLATGYSPIDLPGSSQFRETASLIREAITRARWLGASAVLVSFENAAAESGDALAREWAGDLLRELEPACRAAGVSIGYELVWPAIYATPAEYRSIIDAAGSPCVGCYYDPANLVQQFRHPDREAVDPDPTVPWLERVADRLVRVHLKDFSAADGPAELLTGDVDWAGVRRVLAERGYEGWVVAETEVEPANHLPTLERVSRAVDQFIESRFEKI